MEHIAKLIDEKTLVIAEAADKATRGGYTQVPNIILKDKRLSFGAKTVYGLLLSYAWHNNNVFPGQNRLAQDAGTSRQTVNKYIQELNTHGLLTIQQRGQGRTAIYTLHVSVEGGKVEKS